VGVRIQAFIFNWPGKKQHAAELEANFERLCEVCVINSDDSLRARYPNWHHIGSDGYFTAQWNAAVQRFDGDIFLHIQADIWPAKLRRMLGECVKQISDFGVGVYAPNLNFNPHVFRPESLVRVSEGVYEVPTTDCSFWAIAGDVIRNAPAIDPKVNKLGWGIDLLVAAVAKLKGLKVVRDYRFTAGHIKSRGYDSAEASKQWDALINSLDPLLVEEINALAKERHRLVVSNSSPNPAVRASVALRSRVARGMLLAQRRLEAAYQAAFQLRTRHKTT
jgi:hypothetical protein